jgi:hypothetical protein
MLAKPTTSMPSASTGGGKVSAQWSRRDALYVSILCAAVVTCWMPRFKGPIDLRWDGGVYYILGTSLAEGRGYRLLNEPGEIEANQYPPLLPAIIAAHQLVLGTNDPVIVGQWLRIFYFLIFSVYILTIYLMARSHLPLTYALLAALVCLFNLYTHFLSDLCFPEIPFALVTTLFVLCNRNGNKRAYGVLTAILAVAAFALRTTGTALLAAWIGESVFKRDIKRVVLRLAVAAVAVFGWMLYIAAVESGEQYTNPAYTYQRADYLYYNVSYTRNIFRLKEPFAPELGPLSFSDITARCWHNLQVIPVSLGEVLSSKKRLWEVEWKTLSQFSPLHMDAPWVVDLALITLGCVTLGGIALLGTERQWIIPLYILFSLASICLTPWPQQFTRYLTPLAPFLALSFFTMLLKLQEWFRKVFPATWRGAGRRLAGAIVAVIFLQQAVTLYLVYRKWHQSVVYSGQNDAQVAYRLFFYHDAQRAFDGGIDWLKSRAKPGAVVASSMPHWLYLRTGLKSVMPPFELDMAKAQRLLDSVPVDYLIVDAGLALDTRKYTLPVVQTFSDQWRIVYSDSITGDNDEPFEGRFEIYQRVHP